MKRSAPIFLLSLALSAPLLAQSEFRVNANNDPKPHAPAAAFSSDGGFLVAWSNDRDGVVARSYTPAGQPRGGDLTLAGNVNLPDPGRRQRRLPEGGRGGRVRRRLLRLLDLREGAP